MGAESAKDRQREREKKRGRRGELDKEAAEDGMGG